LARLALRGFVGVPDDRGTLRSASGPGAARPPDVQPLGRLGKHPIIGLQEPLGKTLRTLASGRANEIARRYLDVFPEADVHAVTADIADRGAPFARICRTIATHRAGPRKPQR
jgi:hypothetical protein